MYMQHSISVIQYTTASDESFFNKCLKTIIKFHKLKFHNGLYIL